MRAESLLLNFYYPSRVVRPGRRRRADSQYRAEAARLALRLREIREQAGLTQEQLAARARVAVGTVRKIETGAVVEPGYFTVIGLLTALGVTHEELRLLAPSAALSAWPIRFLRPCCRIGQAWTTLAMLALAFLTIAAVALIVLWVQVRFCGVLACLWSALPLVSSSIPSSPFVDQAARLRSRQVRRAPAPTYRMATDSTGRSVRHSVGGQPCSVFLSSALSSSPPFPTGRADIETGRIIAW